MWTETDTVILFFKGYLYKHIHSTNTSFCLLYSNDLERLLTLPYASHFPPLLP